MNYLRNFRFSAASRIFCAWCGLWLSLSVVPAVSQEGVVVIDASAVAGDASAIERPPRGASYVVVVPQSLLDTVLPLAKLREELGQKVTCITVEAISLHFPGAVEEGIRKLLCHAHERWPPPAPQFLLLAGDAGAIPAWQVRDYQNAVVATDYLYGEACPDLAVGRLPAHSAAELAAMVEKIVQYEKEREGGLWQRRIAIVAGEGGYGKIADALLEGVFEQLMTSYLPQWCDAAVAYGSPDSDYFYPPRLFPHLVAERLNQGGLFFVYVGHGSEDSLGNVRFRGKDHPVFAAQHLPLVDIRQGMPVFLSIACYTGRIGGTSDSLGEAMVKMRHGPVAFIGASQISHPYGNILLGKAFLDGAFEKRISTLGPLLGYVRRQLLYHRKWDLGSLFLDNAIGYFAGDLPLEEVRRDHVRMYNLLGDPALRLYFPTELAHFEVERCREEDRQYLRLCGKTGMAKCQVVATLELPLGQILPRDFAIDPLSLKTPGIEDPEERNTVLKHRRANYKVLALGEADADAEKFSVMLELPRRLMPGRYRLKVALLGAEGAVVGSCVYEKH